MKTLIILSFSTILVTASANYYCSNSLCAPGEQHIACEHSGTFSSICGSDARLIDLDPYVIQQIVDLHNEKRNKIAGGDLPRFYPAARMATMQWDEELASLAVYNVKQCEVKRDACHNTNTFKNSGQNLFIVGYNGPNFPQKRLFKMAINNWFGENKDANVTHIFQYPSEYSGPEIGEFTEMVISDNTHVGCAASTWSQRETTYILFVCNYAVNNEFGKEIYKASATPASECVTGANPNYRNLCTIREFH